MYRFLFVIYCIYLTNPTNKHNNMHLCILIYKIIIIRFSLFSKQKKNRSKNLYLKNRKERKSIKLNLVLILYRV